MPLLCTILACGVEGDEQSVCDEITVWTIGQSQPKGYEDSIMASALLVLCHVADSHNESHQHSTDAALLPFGLVFVVPGFRF